MLMPTEGLINVSGIYPSRLRGGICHNLYLFYHRDPMLKGEDFKQNVKSEQEIISWACDMKKGSSWLRNTSTPLHVNVEKQQLVTCESSEEVKLWQI